MDVGTAVGVASLGIQVCQGLLEYYRDWKDYDDDIRCTYAELSELNKTFTVLHDKLQTASGSVFIDRAKDCLLTCQDGITQLEEKLKKIHKEPSTGLKQKMQAGILRLLYPFRKSTLDKLRTNVQTLLQHLGLALQVIQLAASELVQGSALQIKDAMQDISSLATRIQTTTLDTQAQLSTTAAQIHSLVSQNDRELHLKVLTWLAAPDRAIEHDAARKKHEIGTGQWLLTSKYYQDWLSGATPFLWLHGKAGCCKTVLCSSVVNDVQDHIKGLNDVTMAYFYFTFADSAKQSYRSLLLSMVTELNRKPPVHPSLVELYGGRQPQAASEKALEDVFITLIQQNKFLYLIVDALDECSEDQREEVVVGFKRITQACPATRVLMTSRKEPDIEDLLDAWCNSQIPLDEGRVNADIDIFVKHALATDKKLMRLPAATKLEIQSMFHEKADGMFRWAALQLEAIRNLKILRPSYISTALYEMPRTLDETYERIMSAIDELYFDEARAALEWLVFSNTPLSIAELTEACSISTSNGTDPFLLEGGLEATIGLLGVISPLVLISDADLPSDPSKDFDVNAIPTGEPYPAKYPSERYSQRIRLAHFSVKEYLLSGRLQKSAPHLSRYALSEDKTHHRLAQLCCAYLVYFSNQADVQEWIKEERIPTQAASWEWGGYAGQDYLVDFTPAYPLLPYACNEWTSHLKIMEGGIIEYPEDERLHLRVLAEEKVRVSWLRLHDPNGNFVREPVLDEHGQQTGTRQPGWRDGTRALYWASFLGLRRTVLLLCRQKPIPDLDHVSGKYGTALQAAAHEGHEGIVELLLSEGSQARVQGGIFGTALEAAAKARHVEIVSKLLAADPETTLVQNGDWGTALQAGIYSRQEQVVAVLLKAGADPNAPYHEPPLPWSRYGRHASREQPILTLLHAAVRMRNVQVVDLLISFNAQIEPFSRELLLEAVLQDKSDVAQILLHAGATVDLSYKDLLSKAAGRGNTAMTKLLLEAGTAKEWMLDAALLSAIGRRHREVAKVLIDSGANVNAGAFSAAIESFPNRHEKSSDGHQIKRNAESVAELLLQSGLDVAGDHELLIAATARGSHGIVNLLLQAGANVHDQTTCPRVDFQHERDFDLQGGSALMAAARHGDEELVRILLEAGANPNAAAFVFIGSRYGRTVGDFPTSPLIKAMVFGLVHRGDRECVLQSVAVVKKLLDAGVKVDEGGAALCKAISYCTYWSGPSVKLLAYENCIGPLVQLFLDEGAAFNGPLSALPSMVSCASHTDTTAFVGDLLIEHRIWDASYKQCKQTPQDCHMSLLLGCAMIGHKEDVRSLFEAQGENKIQSWTALEVCELLAAACWTFLPKRPKDREMTNTLILGRMLEARGAEDAVFDAILSESTLDSSMKRFLDSDQDIWVEKARALLQELRACSRDSRTKVV